MGRFELERDTHVSEAHSVGHVSSGLSGKGPGRSRVCKEGKGESPEERGERGETIRSD